MTLKFLLREMEADVLPLIVVDMRLHLRIRLSFRHLDIGLDHIIRLADRNSLGELAAVIGNDFPRRLLVLGPSDLNRYACDRMIIRPPDSSINKCVIVFLGLRILRWRSMPRNGEW